MKEAEHLSEFFRLVDQDARIGPTHISMYAALLQLWKENQWQNPILVYRQQVMSLARIGAHSTYHRILRDLVDSEYIKYSPGFDRKGSKIFFNEG